MKKSAILLLLIALTTSFTFAQKNYNRPDWIFGLGVNAINNNGLKSPLNSPDEWAFSGAPISLSVEHRWSDVFSLEQNVAFNQFTNTDVIDNLPVTRDLTFMTTNTKVKYYFGNHIFGDSAQWLDLAASAGIGIFGLTDQRMNTSGNFGLDATFWFGDHWGLSFKSLGKFAIGDNKGDRVLLTNHFQHAAEIVYRL